MSDLDPYHSRWLDPESDPFVFIGSDPVPFIGWGMGVPDPDPQPVIFFFRENTVH